MSSMRVIYNRLASRVPQSLPALSTHFVKQQSFIRCLQVANMTRISDAIKKDHRELEEYYNKIVNSIDEDEKTRYQNQFTWELARHSHGEELVVYPAFEKNLANGKSMADKDRDEHQAVRLSSREDIVH